MNTASHMLLPVEVDFAATKTCRFTNKAIYSTTIHSQMGRKHCVNNRTLPPHFQSQPNQKFRDVENQRKCCHLLASFQQKNQLLAGNPSCPEFQLQDWLSKLLDYQIACFYRAVFANFCIPVQKQGAIQRALDYRSSKRVRLSKSYLPERQFPISRICNCQFLSLHRYSIALASVHVFLRQMQHSSHNITKAAFKVFLVIDNMDKPPIQAKFNMKVREVLGD